MINSTTVYRYQSWEIKNMNYLTLTKVALKQKDTVLKI